MVIKVWQHVTSGDRFAVGVDSYGYVLGATGPLHHSEIEQAKRGDWDIDHDVTEEIKANRQSYRDVTDRAI